MLDPGIFRLFTGPHDANCSCNGNVRLHFDRFRVSSAFFFLFLEERKSIAWFVRIGEFGISQVFKKKKQFGAQIG